MILRAMALGFMLWLAAAAAMRFAGAAFMVEPALSWMILAAAPTMALITWGLLRLLQVSRGDEAEGAIALALPGMLLNVYAVARFQTVFPDLNPVFAQDFGALVLAANAGTILAGILLTRLSPKDEHVIALRQGPEGS